MPRKRRISVPGCVHHIMARGIEGCDIFRDDEDRRSFLGLLAKGIKSTGFRCYAWALLPNHYHLVIRAGDLPLVALMKPLNSVYARQFSKKHDRRGYLFQDRFKSIPTQDQRYLEELIRYVHLNPVRLGLCPTLEQLARYPWCGDAVLMGNIRHSFQSTGEVLRRFGRTTATARRAYRAFLAAALSRSEPDDLMDAVRQSNAGKEDVHSSTCWVIGDREFVRSAVTADDQRRTRLRRYAQTGWDLEALAAFVAEQFGLPPEQLVLRGRGNTRSDARRAFAYVAHRELGFKIIEIARYLGISGPCASRAALSGLEIARDLKLQVPSQPVRPNS